MQDILSPPTFFNACSKTELIASPIPSCMLSFRRRKTEAHIALATSVFERQSKIPSPEYQERIQTCH